MTVEVVETIQNREYIDVINDSPRVIEVVDEGIRGRTGATVETLAFTKSGPITTPYAPDLGWVLDGDSIIEAISVSLVTAPTTAPITVTLLSDGQPIGSVSVPIGERKYSNGALGTSVNSGAELTISVTSTASVPGAGGLVVTVRRKISDGQGVVIIEGPAGPEGPLGPEGPAGPGGPPDPGRGPAAALATTVPRYAINVSTPLVSGQLKMSLIWLQAGITVSNIVIWSAPTGGSGLTHSLAGLYQGYSGGPPLLATSADNTSTTWPGDSKRTYALTAPYVTPTTGFYYIGLVVVGSVMPNLYAQNAGLGLGPNSDLPVVAGDSTTGLTSALPNPCAAFIAAGSWFYAYVT
jgi:hypothetical protein